MEFKGSRTEANLQAAFAGESQARNKYTYYVMQVLQKKKVTIRLPIFLKKPQATKKNMPKSGLNF